MFKVSSELHRRRKVQNIWGGGGGGGGGGGVGGSKGSQTFRWLWEPNFSLAVGAKLFAGCKHIGAPAPNQCQIITFLTMKTDNIAKLMIEF